MIMIKEDPYHNLITISIYAQTTSIAQMEISANIATIKWNSYITRTDIKVNFVNFIQIIFQSANMETIAVLHILNKK